MNNPRYLLNKIGSAPLFKHWERDYSVFFCYSWGRAHAVTANSNFFGEGSLSLVLNTYLNGVSQYYRLSDDNEVYLKILSGKFKNNPYFLDEILRTYSEYGERMLSIFKEVKEKSIFNGLFIREWAKATSRLVGHQILLIHRSDNYELVFKNNPEILEKIYVVRKKYESAFGLLETHFEIMCKKIIKNKNNITLKKLKVLTPKELANFLENNILPDNMSARKGQIVISHIPSTKIFFGREAIDLVGAIRENEIKNEKSLLNKSLISGRVVFGKGVIRGECQVISDYKKMSEFKEGSILITPSTLPKYNHMYLKARAIITNEGGTLAHAAVLCREFKIPGIVGTKIATDKLKTGDTVSLNLGKGIITIE